jgi:hypothetical protein
MKFRVRYEARKVGSIGLFRMEAREVEAADMPAALERAFAVLHEEGFETRKPISILLIGD